MKHAGAREPPFDRPRRAGPRGAIALAAATKRRVPVLCNLDPKRVELFDVRGDGVVPEVSAHHVAQPLTLISHRQVSSSTKLVAKRGEPRSHSIHGRVPVEDTGADVAVFGFPRTETEYNNNDEDPAARLHFTCDYYDGKVLYRCPDGVGLARWPAYMTDIGPGLSKDLAGASGGPMVCPDTLKVYGLLCSSSESYAVCTDIAPFSTGRCSSTMSTGRSRWVRWPKPHRASSALNDHAPPPNSLGESKAKAPLQAPPRCTVTHPLRTFKRPKFLTRLGPSRVAKVDVEGSNPFSRSIVS